MILISGTKRSGTSMWMQVMVAAGFPVLGKAFPRNWERTIKEANPDGFYESALRQGIYFATNPHPLTGDYFMPEDVKEYAVKVFVPGVIRSERAFISHLIANVREWREYESSIERLRAMEAEARPADAPRLPEVEHMPPVLEWWMENFALVRDISIRKYPARLQTYDKVLSHPEEVIKGILEWIGSGDLEAAVAAVRPERRTQDKSEVREKSNGSATEQTTKASVSSDRVHGAGIDPKHLQVFDELYTGVAEGLPFSKSLLNTLNQTNQELLPLLKSIQEKVQRSLRERDHHRRELRAKRRAEKQAEANL